MGFQIADVLPLAKFIRRMPGVSGVWVLEGVDDRACTMWVAVAGLDDEAYQARMAVRDEVEAFLVKRDDEMKHSRFTFDYHVVADQPDLGSVQIPPAAIPIEAAA